MCSKTNKHTIKLQSILWIYNKNISKSVQCGASWWETWLVVKGRRNEIIECVWNVYKKINKRFDLCVFFNGVLFMFVYLL